MILIFNFKEYLSQFYPLIKLYEDLPYDIAMNTFFTNEDPLSFGTGLLFRHL